LEVDPLSTALLHHERHQLHSTGLGKRIWVHRSLIGTKQP
jgi:hypothetical protein